MIKLFEDERIDYLLADESMEIIQSPSVFSFSLDALLLADFAYVPKGQGSILDLCTGNGVIPLLLSRKTKAHITGVEIQERIFKMATKNVILNKLSAQLHMIHGDLKNMQPLLGHSSFDVVTCNPPYFRTSETAHRNASDYFTIARHEVLCTLEDVVKACKLHVRPGGKVAIVHRPERLVDLITLFRKYKLEPKRLQFVYSKTDRDANMVLIEGIRDGNVGLTMHPPLYIYNDDNTYTKTAEDIIYGRL